MADETAPPKASLSTTYQWADGDHIGDFGWMTDIEQFDCDMENADEPREVLIEHWTRTAVEVRTLFPPLVSCTYEDQEPCDEDAVVWQQEPGEDVWMQACERHRLADGNARNAEDEVTRCAGRSTAPHPSTVMVDGRCPVCGENESERCRFVVGHQHGEPVMCGAVKSIHGDGLGMARHEFVPPRPSA